MGLAALDLGGGEAEKGGAAGGEEELSEREAPWERREERAAGGWRPLGGTEEMVVLGATGGRETEVGLLL